MPVFRLDKTIAFPPPKHAREDGLLAVGGDLSVERLVLAYSLGIFPWYTPGEPILWWAPDPRLVLFPEELKIPRRLSRTIRQRLFDITFDQVFQSVITNCAEVERNSGPTGTWLDDEMITAYCKLHELGIAHSVECWKDGSLVGGLYGVAIGGMFFGESMFSKARDSSKVALVFLVEKLISLNFGCIDCQVSTDHLISMGAREISGDEFHLLMERYIHNMPTGNWSQKNPPENSGRF